MVSTMTQEMIRVEVSRVIRRPLELVRKQFADMRHHEAQSVHPHIRLTVLDEKDGVFRLKQEALLFGFLTQTDELTQKFLPSGELFSDVIQGANCGMQISQTFEAEGSDATVVRVCVNVPAVGAKKFLKPIFAFAIRKTVEKGLEEDRRDLEDVGYPRV
jgi:hypothetical protein